MTKWFRNILLLIASGILLFWLVPRIGLDKPFKNLFTSKPVLIDETPILIENIRSIAQLATINAYYEVVVDSTAPTRGSGFVNAFNSMSPIPILPSADKRIVIIGRGKVVAGMDLSQLAPDNFRVSGDTITVDLPKPQVLDVIINPSGYETFIEKGKWENEEVTKVKISARKQMVALALQNQVLSKSFNQASVVIKNFLRGAGYTTVIIKGT